MLVLSVCSQHDGPFSVSVLGDLHLEPAQMHLFHEARQQLVVAMDQPSSSNGLSDARVVQLGDLGGYQHRPGELLAIRLWEHKRLPKCIHKSCSCCMLLAGSKQ